MRFDDIALQVPRVLLPTAAADLHAWCVIACDQHTSNPAYWDEVKTRVATAPSTLNLVFPEAFLNAPDRPERIQAIQASMRAYLSEGLLRELDPGFVLVERQTTSGKRRGLMVALDLEQYDYRPGTTPLIRTTEGTLVERLPPRIEVRRAAPLELPHIVVLIDDPQDSVIGPLFDQSLPQLYDTELMLAGGHLKGWQVNQQAHINQVVEALRGLVRRDPQDERMLYAMGDGNHSFATAKEVWEEIKREAGGLDAVAEHPARHALVELVNLHDKSMVFEPIHRLAVGQPAATLLDRLVEAANADGLGASWAWGENAGAGQCFAFKAAGKDGVLRVEKPALSLEVATLDGLLEKCAGAEVDYIHGDEVLASLGDAENAVGFFLPSLDKDGLFEAIARDGALPRKTFSVGEAEEKRYYLESRRITA